MRHTQFLIFEICRECNLGKRHSKCPNLHPQRCEHCDKSQPMTDAQIIAAATAAYRDLGFAGLIGWHYYNEPLMAEERIFDLMKSIKSAEPRAGFVLWSNGQLLPWENNEQLSKYSKFSKCWLTNYDNDPKFLRLQKYIPDLHFFSSGFDERLSPRGESSAKPCRRMFTELIFDYFGNVHICCVDWRGEVKVGNIHDEPLPVLVERFRKIREKMMVTMRHDAPTLCQTCRLRHKNVAPLVLSVAKKTTEYLRAAEVEADRAKYRYSILPRPQRVAVCAVAYRIPEKRVRDFFAWNDQLFRDGAAQVFLTVERPYAGLPRYARQLPYPLPMSIFNLSATKNFAIRHAIESGYDIIIATDCDIKFSPEIWRAMCEVSQGRAIVPVYLMAAGIDKLNEHIPAPNATGTVAMRAREWREAHYHEGCVGYGSDDAILLRAIIAKKIEVVRNKNMPCWHIAHIANTPQKEFDHANPRIDHWGRKEGFNPENFAHNRKIMSAPIYDDPTWGLAGGKDIAFVVTHWRLPEQRLRDFLAWNAAEFERIGARLIVVDDCRHDDMSLPYWVRVAIYPQPMPIFSLARTSNYGIRLAGQGVVCKTDIDCMLSPELVDRIVKGEGVCPQYRMAATTKVDDLLRARVWDASKGTIAMPWESWDRIQGYDERMVGYGIEDGDAFYRAARLGLCRRAPEKIYHIAHNPDDVMFARRLWNPVENPKEHEHNSGVRAVPWARDDWGWL